MDDAQERQLYETIRLTNNSINMLATAVMEMRADIHSIYERQTNQLAAWEQRWRRFMGDTPNPYTTDDPPTVLARPDLASWE